MNGKTKLLDQRRLIAAPLARAPLLRAPYCKEIGSHEVVSANFDSAIKSTRLLKQNETEGMRRRRFTLIA